VEILERKVKENDGEKEKRRSELGIFWRSEKLKFKVFC